MLPRTCLLYTADFFVLYLSRLSLNFCPLLFCLYVVEQLQTAHRPAVVSPPPLGVCRSAGGVWESGERRRTRIVQARGEDLSLKSTKSGSSSHRLPELAAQKPPMLSSGTDTTKPHFTCFNPLGRTSSSFSAPPSNQPPSTGGRNCFVFSRTC